MLVFRLCSLKRLFQSHQFAPALVRPASNREDTVFIEPILPVCICFREFSFFSCQIEAFVYFCEPSGTCRMEGIAYDVPLLKTDGDSKLSLQIQHEVKL